MGAASKSISRRAFVLDGSVALSWCFPDEGGRAAAKLLKTLAKGTAVVPALWFLEVANALATGERRGRLTSAQADDALRLLSHLPVHVDERSGFSVATDMLTLARRRGLTAYDAAYLELALRLQLPIATFDRGLRKAARTEGLRVLPA